MVHFDAIAREMWFGDCWGRAEHSTAGRRRTDEDGEEAWNGYVAHLAQHRRTTAMRPRATSGSHRHVLAVSSVNQKGPSLAAIATMAEALAIVMQHTVNAHAKAVSAPLSHAIHAER